MEKKKSKINYRSMERYSYPVNLKNLKIIGTYKTYFIVRNSVSNNNKSCYNSIGDR